ncbi:hypothetical protein DICVIV_07733 [Dictyocaulus viviparus]|uniref:CID domain-containing protein n=1 Tax=Dictyocaulus viviparus TaxID=29172 RepID=A0A0D8XNL8_DICVI|nr:hypothetical protein DICVIV_07733 [Dictyocaulus viviparus]
MTGLTLDAIMRRFQDVHSLSQEAIETISLWVMHYKDKRSIDLIVEAWLESFKIAKKDEQRIALFYIMNDVVQRAKNKHMDVLIPAFQPAVLSAVTMGKSSPSVKHVMNRCIDIFGERQVFTEASVNVMKNMLQSEENGEGDESFAELDSDEVYRKIELFERGRLIVNRGMEVIRNGDFDCKALMKERMRDRTVAAQLVMETQQVLSQISSFRHSMEEQKRKMLQLIETLELAKRNFSHQLRDVTVVEDEMEKSGVYPAATPPRDAPSPTANDDIYATGVENALQTFRIPGSRDNTETTDMDLDDDSTPIDVGGTSPLSGNLPPPPAPPTVLENRVAGFAGVSQLLGSCTAPSFQSQAAYGVSQSSLASQSNVAMSSPNSTQSTNFNSNISQPSAVTLPPPITTQPPPNIQISFPPPVVQQRFGDVDERVPPIMNHTAPGQAATYQIQQSRLPTTIYAEEGPSHIDYHKQGYSSEQEQHSCDNQYYTDGGSDGFYQKPPYFHNSGNYTLRGRGRPRSGEFYGHNGGRSDHWRKPVSHEFRGGRGFNGPRGNQHMRVRGGFHGGGEPFPGGNYQRGRGRGNWGRDDY